jgi:uncharacterized membrane protein YsdA (DUF1294 family)
MYGELDFLQTEVVMIFALIAAWVVAVFALIGWMLAANEAAFLRMECDRTKAMLRDARISRQYASRLQ